MSPQSVLWYFQTVLTHSPASQSQPASPITTRESCCCLTAVTGFLSFNLPQSLVRHQKLVTQSPSQHRKTIDLSIFRLRDCQTTSKPTISLFWSQRKLPAPISRRLDWSSNLSAWVAHATTLFLFVPWHISQGLFCGLPNSAYNIARPRHPHLSLSIYL